MEKLLQMYSCVNPVTYSSQQLCRKTSELNSLKRTFSYTYSLLALCQAPEGKGLLAVREHSVMMDVVTLHITKDHPSQITQDMAAKRDSMKFIPRKSTPIKKIIYSILLCPFMLDILDIL